MRDSTTSADDLSPGVDPRIERHSPVPWWLTRPGRAALGALVLFALAYALKLGRSLFMPLIVSFLLAILLAPIVRVLRRFRLPGPLAAAIVVAAFACATGAVVYVLAEPATSWIERAPQSMREIERRLWTFKASMIEARQAADRVEQLTSVGGDSPPAEVTVKQPSLAARVAATTQAALLYGAEVLVLLYFLLATGETLLRKLVRIPARLRAKIRVVRLTTEIERDISNYLFTVACINAGLGAATAIAMYLLGMPNPLLWGVLAAVLNFIPYLGSAVTLLVVFVVAVLTFDSQPRALLVPAVFLFLATMEGQFITPIVVGRRMSLNPTVIVIALMMGTWMWGIAGLLIAVPMLAIVKIYCAHDEGLSPVAKLLGRD